MTVKYLFIFLAFRFSSIYFIRTFHVADEYWQSLEVAHNIVFDYGYKTWEWTHGLRSYVYPTLFAFVFKLLSIFQLDSVTAVVLLPRCVQATLSAICDYYFMLWCKSLGCDLVLTRIAIFTNWFWYYCSSRTLVNSFEMSLTTIGLYYYPWEIFHKTKNGNSSYITYSVIAAVICIVRPTAVTIWGPLALCNLFFLSYKEKKHVLLHVMFPVASIVILLSSLIDWVMYERFVFVPFNFMKFNLIRGVASFYGVHPYHWYLTQGIPVVLGAYFIPFYLQMGHLIKTWVYHKHFSKTKSNNSKTSQIEMVILAIVILNIMLLSVIPHKEFRFLLPLSSMMMAISLKYLTLLHILDKVSIRKMYMSVNILVFIIPTFLFGWIHQRGTLNLIHHLSGVAQQHSSNTSILFLMPCHSTPLYSHLHMNVSTRFLTCEPPLQAQYHDESEEFYNDPMQWIHKHLVHINPSHIACFDVLPASVHQYLEANGFVQQKTFHHALFPEGRVGEYVILYGKG